MFCVYVIFSAVEICDHLQLLEHLITRLTEGTRLKHSLNLEHNCFYVVRSQLSLTQQQIHFFLHGTKLISW